MKKTHFGGFSDDEPDEDDEVCNDTLCACNIS